MSEHVDILAFGAHPDDVEIGAGGILAKQAALGYKTAICELTYAELSSNGDVETRKREGKKAAAILQLAGRYSLGFPDRGLTGTAEQIQEMVRLIRRLQPKVVLAPYWEDRHPDHVACSRLVKEAVFDAAIRKKVPEVAPHRVQRLYYYFINNIGKADVIVDISTVYDKKRAAILAFESQFVPGPGRVATPLNQPSYLAMIEGRDQVWGHQIGAAYGEGLVSGQPLALRDLVF
ncbi:bacillithiol biosynthesis deacetylase BshB1 [Marinithermofilum abyssi]|uniref:Bacillithiol biosynthesis deacetylase BshB1 n=1 Tax=Marinithermofilum abyssi TaxID=1571185 RepID=A0A8J2VFR4_9BACL|nr:bacillithiol biosynthesis deacetylase BshB1 [Marinithermofilum abyssi]GGE11596.1 bacillithiol biosynthesis deacetylase BshB1 [Marinithermofilum abyssi]